MPQLSDKQKLSFNESTAKINIWEGAVRSGKTFVSIWRFLQELRNGPPGEYCVITKTYDSFKRNIFPIVDAIIGTEARHYSGKRELVLFDKTVHIIGADDERAETKVRGPTFMGAYVDEATIIPESVFKMLISRCMMGGAKIFATTNPDSPFHWLKVDYLENNPDVKSWQFRLTDNPALTEAEKDYLKRQYKGLWYQRFIEGLWVQAEGSIYDMFDEKTHVITFPPHDPEYYIVGVDYGTTNPCAFVLIGVKKSGYPNMWVEDEYYYDSKLKQRQKTDSEYAEDFIRFVAGKRVKAIYVDPSAASFKTELYRHNVLGVHDADHEVIDGIRFVANLLSNGTLKINACCKNLIHEFQSYVWNANAASKGDERPIKENDHCFCAGTLVMTESGQKPIDQIQTGEKVLTRMGFRTVLEKWSHVDEVYDFSFYGKSYRCTRDHRFFTERGWVPVSKLMLSDILYMISPTWESSGKPKLSNLTGIGTDAIRILRALPRKIISQGTVSFSIERFGSSSMEKFPKDIMFITKTGIPVTMIFPIWNAFQSKSISKSIRKLLANEDLRAMLWMQLQDGTGLEKGENGIESMQSDIPLVEMNGESVVVSNVDRCIQHSAEVGLDFVRISVNQDGEEQLVLMMSTTLAKYVSASIEKIDIPKRPLARSNVLEGYEEEIVYNLTVDGCHEFFAEGILVKNCLDATRYALFSHFFNKSTQKIDWDHERRKAFGQGPDLPHWFRDGGPRGIQ